MTRGGSSGPLAALLAAPEDVVGLLLAAAEGGGSRSGGVCVAAFAALVELIHGRPGPESDRVWASPALPAAFEEVCNAEFVGVDGGRGRGFEVGAARREDRAFLLNHLLMKHGPGMAGQLLVGWLNIARRERQPALEAGMARTLADPDPTTW